MKYVIAALLAGLVGLAYDTLAITPDEFEANNGWQRSRTVWRVAGAATAGAAACYVAWAIST